jgi:hypothetical protein
MKIISIAGLAVAVVLAASGIGWAHMGGGFGPWGGMGSHGGMAYRWSGPSGETGWHSMGFSISGLTLTKEQAAQIANAHVQVLRNPNVKLGEVSEFDSTYEAPILTRDGSLVERLVVDKRTGWVRSVY